MDRSTLSLVIGGALVLTLALLRRATSSSAVRNRPLSDVDKAAVDTANRLWKSDPATAHRILDDHFEKEGQQEDEERARLRQQATTDRAAAQELRRRLQEDLEVWEHLLMDARKKARKDLTAQQAVVNLEQWDRETRVELAHLDDLIRELSA